MQELLFYVFLYLVVVGLILLVSYFFDDNEKNSIRPKLLERVQLMNQITKLRLFRMLKHVGLNFQTYLYTTPKEKICNHITNCKRCETKITCDDYFNHRHFDRKIDFCPNLASLHDLYQRQIEHIDYVKN